MEEHTYLIVWGVRVSGYTQFVTVEVVQGLSFDNAFNRKYLSNPPLANAIVMEVWKLDICHELTISKGERLI